MFWNAARKALKAVVFTAALLGIVGTATHVEANGRVEHYEGKSAETLEQAVVNFSEYNVKLSAVLEKDALGAQDLETIHELTYTLENALEVINRELAALANTLEELHLASESHDVQGTKTYGAAYLETARKVVP